MMHARIAARAFNTPLLIEPSKAMAFLSGLGPRILGRRVEIGDENGALESTVVPPARASILAGGMLDDYRKHGEAPYPVVDGIAVIEISGVLIHRGGWIGQSSGQTSYEGIAAQIEAAANDPAVRGLALEIDSFGGEVAGVFDLADRIRAIRATKPVWAFVAEHAFSAGYALASQATRILLPSGSHKVDGNPYEPLPADVRDDIQREIDVLRFLFAETVAAGRGAKLTAEAALATEAAGFRGTDAVASGLADKVTDLARGFAAFRQLVARTPALSPARARRASLSHPKQEAHMATEHDPGDSPQDVLDQATGPQDGTTDTADGPAAAPETPQAVAPHSAPVVTQPGNLAELSAQFREAAAEIAEIAAQASRLGIAIDAAKALRDGTTPEALRRLVIERASAAADARDIVAAPPSPIRPQATESPIVAAAKRAAAASARA